LANGRHGVAHCVIPSAPAHEISEPLAVISSAAPAQVQLHADA
jgi:hypothetical protein